MSKLQALDRAVAVGANLFVPGLGHLLNGKWKSAAVYFGVCGIGYGLWFLVYPMLVALCFHAVAILTAFKLDDEDKSLE